MIPTLTTDRLTLRQMQRSDFDAYAAFMASPRSGWMGGPRSENEAWEWFTNDVATYPLYGFGNRTIEMGGAIAGFTGLVHPPEFPEPECGWFLLDGYTGMGLATEAARAVIDDAFATTQLDSIVSYIGAENTASINVAERLGAKLDADAASPGAYPCLVYRHTKGAAA